jgi:hypothetical protein
MGLRLPESGNQWRANKRQKASREHRVIHAMIV